MKSLTYIRSVNSQGLVESKPTCILYTGSLGSYFLMDKNRCVKVLC